MQKIGIYGGTFDPVHHAHLILARLALERFALERIVFIPTRLSPHKNASVATPEARLQMLRSAIEGEAQFEVNDCELQREPPSYTIDTVEKLRQKYQGAHLFLLIGESISPQPKFGTESPAAARFSIWFRARSNKSFARTDFIGRWQNRFRKTSQILRRARFEQESGRHRGPGFTR